MHCGNVSVKYRNLIIYLLGKPLITVLNMDAHIQDMISPYHTPPKKPFKHGYPWDLTI